MSDLIGRDLGRYHILEQLGEGGMATVYKAFDTRLECDMAVKVISTAKFTQEAVSRALIRFEREAKALARLTHPNIVKVTDYGEYEGSPYLVMEYLPGGNLKQYINERKRLPWQEAAQLILPIAQALEFAHSQHIIHRDVKPSNILLTESGQPMLTDFGVAKVVEEEATVDLTGTAAAVGTPEYMAPEQTGKNFDHRVDIYALGIVFYEMVTGRRPYEADTPLAVLIKQASEPLPRPSLFVPGLPEAVENVIIKALAKRPADRYQTMREFGSAIEKLLIGRPAPGKFLVPSRGLEQKKQPAFETQETVSQESSIEKGKVYPPKDYSHVPTKSTAPQKRKRSWLVWALGTIIGLFVLGVGFFIVIFVFHFINSSHPTIPPTQLASTMIPTNEAAPLIIPTDTKSNSAQPPSNKLTLVRWFIGLGTGSDPSQVPIEQSVVDDFNVNHKDIQLSLEIVPNASARDTLSTDIAAGAGPDIVGPVGWIGSEAFHGQWLDLSPYIESSGFDTSVFIPATVHMYQTTDEGQVSLPFTVYPSAIYYNTTLFQRAGVNPPPAKYGDKYTLPDGTIVDWNWDTVAKVAKLLTIDKTGRNSTQAGFNITSAIQYGFSFGWENNPNYWATFMSNGGRLLLPGGSTGTYQASIPNGWKQAWAWVYNGIWGINPFIPNDTVAGGADFDSGNVFASGKVAMVEIPSWYLCCLDDLTKVGGRFDFGAMPIGFDGVIAGRMDADSFRIWKGTQHPNEAFRVFSYLITTGVDKLVVGSSSQAPAYGALTAIPAKNATWLANKKTSFPFIQNWDTLLAGMNYPDVPSAEAFMPNINEAWVRIYTFGNLLSTTKGINLVSQEATLISDLNGIFNK